MDITKISVPIVLAVSLAGYAITGFATYYSSLEDVRTKIHEVRLEREQNFVKKDEMKEMAHKLDKIAEDVATIRGYIQREGPRR